MIYLDNNATTRSLPEVVDAVVESMTTRYGNPSLKILHEKEDEIDEQDEEATQD